MLCLESRDSTYIDEQVSGFAKRLVDDGIMLRQSDLLLLGFAYAVRNRIKPQEKIKRHDLLRVAAVDPNMRLAVEAVAPWFARELGIEPPNDSRGLLDFICRVGSAGIAALQKEWEGRAKSQIELSILRLGATATS
jgi:hypothetical protein